jgi:hypothetical protein
MVTLNPFEQGRQIRSAISVVSPLTPGSATYASPDPKIDTQDTAWISGRKLPPLTTSLIVGVMPTEGGVNTWVTVDDVLGA